MKINTEPLLEKVMPKCWNKCQNGSQTGAKMSNTLKNACRKIMLNFDASKRSPNLETNGNLAHQVVANLTKRGREASQLMLDFRRRDAGAL